MKKRLKKKQQNKKKSKKTKIKVLTNSLKKLDERQLKMLNEVAFNSSIINFLVEKCTKLEISLVTQSLINTNNGMEIEKLKNIVKGQNNTILLLCLYNFVVALIVIMSRF